MKPRAHTLQCLLAALLPLAAAGPLPLPAAPAPQNAGPEIQQSVFDLSHQHLERARPVFPRFHAAPREQIPQTKSRPVVDRSGLEIHFGNSPASHRGHQQPHLCAGRRGGRHHQKRAAAAHPLRGHQPERHDRDRRSQRHKCHINSFRSPMKFFPNHLFSKRAAAPFTPVEGQTMALHSLNHLFINPSHGSK